MKRVLLTGMSGTGKSRAVSALVQQGYWAVDLDDGWCDMQPDGRQLWREGAVDELLSAEGSDVLFVAGCEENMGGFLPRFDSVILLSAPTDILLERLATRTNNPYGKAADERRRILEDIDTVEPMLRAVADHEIQTTQSPDEVVAAILKVVGP